MRVYLPSTLPGLADVLAKEEAGPPPLRAFAVTPALREAYASGDDEELEYVAMLAAARQSLRVAGGRPGGPAPPGSAGGRRPRCPGGLAGLRRRSGRGAGQRGGRHRRDRR